MEGKTCTTSSTTELLDDDDDDDEAMAPLPPQPRLASPWAPPKEKSDRGGARDHAEILRRTQRRERAKEGGSRRGRARKGRKHIIRGAFQNGSFKATLWSADVVEAIDTCILSK